MAQVINNQEIYLNGKHYNIKGPVRPQTVSRFASKMTIGDDSYENEAFRSNWITNDQREGIGLEEMTDPKTQSRRCWWSQLDLAHKTLPPLATAITLPTLPTITYAGADPISTPGGSVNTDAAGWSNDFRGKLMTVTIICTFTTGAGGETATFYLNDGNSNIATQVESVTGAKTIKLTGTLHATLADKIRVTITLSGGSGHSVAGITMSIATVTTFSSVKWCNYNSDLYFAINECLYKIENDTGSVSLEGIFPNTITALTASVGNVLFIFLGDADNYWYMTSAGVFADAATGGAANCQNANLGIHYGAALYKMNAAGQIYFCADPARDDPTWTTDGTLVNNGLASGSCQRLLTERDKDGATVIKAITKSGVYEHDGANDRFILEKPFPEHTNGGKGGLVYNDRIYYSAGLNVKRFRPGSNADSAEEVGLDLDDGVPAEYAGEIMSLIDGGNVIYALVDASQVTGTGYSWIAKLGKYGWSCFWSADQLNAAVYDFTGSSGTGWANLANAYDNNTATYATSPTAVAGGYTAFAVYTIGATIANSLRFYASDPNYPSDVMVMATIDIDVSTDGNTWVDVYEGTYTNDAWTTYFFALGTYINVRVRFKNTGSETAEGAYLKEIQFYEAVNDKTMHDGIVSSVYSYRLWYDHNNLIYYIPLQRSQLSPKKISGYTYAAGPVWHITSRFAAGAPTEAKLQALLRAFCKDTTANETIRVMYRIDKTYTDLFSGWTVLGTIVAAGDGVSTEYSFASSAGLAFKYIQFAFVLVRGTTNTLAPVLNSYTSVFLKKNKKVWTWSFTLNLAEPSQDGTPKELQEFLETALDLGTLLEFTFLNETDTTETHYVDVINFSGWRGTGDYHQGQYEMTVLEP